MTGYDNSPPPTRKKVNVTATISPHIHDWVASQVDNKVFSSPSDAISIALCELKYRMEGESEKESAIDEIKKASLEAIELIQKTAASNENSTMLLLNLLTTHDELVEEINNLIRARRGEVSSNSKKVTFK
ncbi:MAG: hypothetical protein M0R48_11410 [Candidatus Omnitrophica bacterium]|nr:hypothetical protein [Candidatus Omnitrophota bacterium]